MTKSFKDFSNEIKQLGLNKDDLIRQLYMALSTQQGIPWQKYDPANPPEEGTYLAIVGKSSIVSVHLYKDIDYLQKHVVTHFAPINLPIQD